MKTQVLVLIGPPASGKGFLAFKISNKLGIDVVTPGEIYAKIREENSELGNIVREALKDGGLCPNDLTNQIMREQTEKLMANQPYIQGVIFDGYPRNEEQYNYLIENFDVVAWLHVDSDYDTLLEASVNRRKCISCNKVLSAKTMQLEKDLSRCTLPNSEICARRNGESACSSRFDDGFEMYPKRYNVYLEETKPLLEKIKNNTNYKKFECLNSSVCDILNLTQWISRKFTNLDTTLL